MRSFKTETLNYLITILIACFIVWFTTMTQAEYQTQIRLKTTHNAALEQGVIAGYNEAMYWVVIQCKNATSWYWLGDPTQTTYTCREAGVATQLMVDNN